MYGRARSINMRCTLLLCVILVTALGLASCGSYTLVSRGTSPSEADFEVGYRYRVTTVDGYELTGKVISVNEYSVEFRDYAVWLADIATVERHDMPNYRLLGVVLSVAAYLAIVASIR